MAQDIVDQLQSMCARLREKLMQNPEYRALQTLERTVQDLSACLDVLPSETDIANGIDMSQGADHMVDALADALGAHIQQSPQAPRAADHLPSHRVA